MTDLLAPQNLPFAVALALLAAVAVLQLVGAGDILGEADADLDFDADGDIGLGGAVASVLGLGRLPVLIWLSTLLAVFALVGLSGQHLAEGLLGAMLPALPAGGLALVAALPLTGLLARPLARILPHDETTAVPIDSLVGRRGRVVIGRATPGSPARTSVADAHGHPHHVMVEPAEPGVTLSEGEDVLLTARDGDLFQAIRIGAPPSLTIE